jgi:hypothetical protein
VSGQNNDSTDGRQIFLFSSIVETQMSFRGLFDKYIAKSWKKIRKL